MKSKPRNKSDLITIIFILLVLLWGSYAYRHTSGYQHSKIFESNKIQDLGIRDLGTKDGFTRSEQDRAIRINSSTNWCEAISK